MMTILRLGGLLFKPGGSNLQHATAFSFLFLVYASYLNKANREIDCGGKVFASPRRLIQLARSQVCKFTLSNHMQLSKQLVIFIIRLTQLVMMLNIIRLPIVS